MRRVTAWFVGNNVLANVVLTAVVVTGVLAAMALRHEAMPEISLNLISVRVPFPGANPKEVEEGISRRLEAAIDGLEGVKTYSTFSLEGVAIAEIGVAEGADPREVKDRIEDAVDGIPTLPEESEQPRISLLRDDQEVINLALWGEVPERQLKAWAEEVRADLQRHPDVSLVFVEDTRTYEVDIEVSKAMLRTYGLTLDDIRGAIERSSLNVTAGTMESDGGDVQIRAVGLRETGRELADVVVKAGPGGERITLERIARIDDGFTRTPAYGTFNGHPAVMVEAYQAQGEDTIAISDAVTAYAEAKQAELPAGLHISACFDESQFVRDQIAMLTKNGIMGLLLLLGVLWLFMDGRLAFWVAMGIPISFAGAMLVLWLLGQTINQISLIAFIIVLGILVDDAIVVSEAIFHHRRQGKGPLQAAVDGVCEVGGPVTAAILTTMAAFVPLFLIPGEMGQIIAVIPLVVIAALAVSLLESLFLLPAHLNHLPELQMAAEPGSHAVSRTRDRIRSGLEWLARQVYFPAVRQAVAHRYMTSCVAVSVLLVTAGVIAGGHLRVVFWPPVDGDVMAALVEFPDGTPAEVTRDALEQTKAALERVAEHTETRSGEPLIVNLHTRVFQETPHMGRIFVQIVPPSHRTLHSQEISAAWETEVGPIPGALRQSFFKAEINGGSAPIEIWLQARDMDALRAATEQLKDRLRGYEGTYQVADDFRPGKKELQVTLKPHAESLGISLDDVARHLRSGYYGAEALRLQRGRDDVRVRVVYPEEERETLAELESSRIRTPGGQEVPILSVADITFAEGYSSIRGTNGLRRIAVTAAVDTTRSSPDEIVADLERQYLDGLVAQYPAMSWSLQGAAQENQETMAGLQNGFIIAMLGIFVIMATMFRSYLQPFIILLIVPFGMVGAVWGHLVVGIPLTFLSLFGIIALTGVVVNDAIVLLECVNEMMGRGMALMEAVCEAGVRRFRAIFLTSLSTCAGLIPLILEKDLQAQIVIPMAVSVAAGVAFSTLLNLLLLPSLFAIVSDIRCLAYRLRFGTWPNREDVEPGVVRARRRAAIAELDTKADSQDWAAAHGAQA